MIYKHEWTNLYFCRLIVIKNILFQKKSILTPRKTRFEHADIFGDERLFIKARHTVGLRQYCRCNDQSDNSLFHNRLLINFFSGVIDKKESYLGCRNRKH